MIISGGFCMHPIATFLPYEHIYLILTRQQSYALQTQKKSDEEDWNEASSMENKKSHHDNEMYFFNRAKIKQIN